MNDREAAAIIKELVPYIQASGPDALIKYASEHDLAPAQLEKLGQVTNRLITLHHIETADDRGSSVPLLDVPGMVSRYANADAVEKAAGVRMVVETHDVRQIDLTRLFMQEAGWADFEKVAAVGDPLTSVLEFSGLLTKLQTAHWEADTETEEHEALGDLYDALRGCLDRYVESAMGDAGVRHMEPAEVDLSPNIDRRALVGDIKTAVKVLQRSAKKADSEALLNIAAEMEEHVLKAIYKLDNKVEKAAEVTDLDIEDAANDVYGQAVLDREKAASVVASLIADGHGEIHSVAMAEREALAEGYDPERVKLAFDWLCAMPKAAGAERFEGQARVRSMSAETRLSRAVSDLVEAHTVVDLSRDVSREMGKAAAVAAPPVDADDDLNDEPTRPQTSGDEYTADADNQGGADDQQQETAHQDRGYESEEGGGGGGSRPSKPSGAKKTDSKSDSKGGGGSVGDIAGFLAAPVGLVADSMSTAADMTNNALSAITGKERQNTAQRKLDVSVDDIVRTVMIRRMVATDPILREADPRRVLEVYNAVARLNPSVASNPEQLRLALREAVSYDGLTLDSQKLLADTRKAEADATAKERDNQRSYYSVGGSELPALLKAPTSK